MAFRPVGVHLAAALLALAALAGCQAGPPGPASSGPTGQLPGGDASANCETAPDSPNDPLRLFFPSQGVRVDVTRVGLTAEQDINLVPLDRRPLVAGWYCEGPQPGDLGPSVIVGHVDWGGSLAAFGRLAALRKGDRVEVTNRAGALHRFVITGKQQVEKAAFPFDRVFSDQPISRLTLITCGGQFDHSADTYVDSNIIYASLDPATG